MTTLLQEFLSAYFNGQTHNVGATANVAFPAADIRMQQSGLPQPLTKPGITVLWIGKGRTREYWGQAAGKPAKIAHTDATLILYVRAADKGAALQTSDLLYELLVNTHETYALSAKGVRWLRPGTPILIADGASGGTGGGQYFMRQINLAVRLVYNLNTQA